MRARSPESTHVSVRGREPLLHIGLGLTHQPCQPTAEAQVDIHLPLLLVGERDVSRNDPTCARLVPAMHRLDGHRDWIVVYDPERILCVLIGRVVENQGISFQQTLCRQDPDVDFPGGVELETLMHAAASCVCVCQISAVRHYIYHEVSYA